MKTGKITCLLIVMVILLFIPGCFKEIVGTSRSLPHLVWPAPPETPRIRFLNSVTSPEDFNIMESILDRIVNFLKGKIKTSIIKPYGVITDQEDRLYVVDNYRRIVHVFNPENKEYYFFPREGETTFLSPIDIAIDKNGTIYVSDSRDGIVKVFRNHGKTFVKNIGKGLFSRPSGLAYNEITDELLVVDTKYAEVIRYDIITFKFRGTLGNMGNVDGTFNNPTNIFVDRSGQIFITDSLNFRVQVFKHDGTFVRTFGKGGDSPGYFSRPKGVAVDSDGNIYVVDALFDNIQIFNSQGELLMDFGSSGEEYGKFWLPAGIYIDSKDRIYVSDSYNKRVQIFQYMKANEIPAR